MNFFRGRPSTFFRSTLALLLVCVQVFAAAHAVSHVGELSAQARSDSARASVPYEGGVPAAERHERCLLCLAAANLASALPSSVPVLAVDSLPPPMPCDGFLVLRAFRLPRPHSRGPPVFPV
jgi:hypothetical protein